MVTTNISLPREDWRALKVLAASQETSMADLIRRSVKQTVKRLTVNGFTPEFEEEVLKAAAEPVDMSDAWDGKGSFVDWALKPRSKRHGKS